MVADFIYWLAAKNKKFGNLDGATISTKDAGTHGFYDCLKGCLEARKARA